MSEPRAVPQYSADGRWWWTGTNWVPASRGTSSAGKIVLALVIFSVVVLTIFVVISEMAASEQHRRDTERSRCISFGC